MDDRTQNDTHNDALDTLPAVVAVTGLAKPTIYKLIKAGGFPRPVKCGSASRWLRSEIRGWIASKVAERDAATNK